MWSILHINAGHTRAACTHTHTHTLRHTDRINQNFDPNTNCRPSTISCWFVITLLCKVCSFPLKRGFPSWKRESDTVRVIPIRGNQFGVRPPIFHSRTLYSSPLISPFIIFTLHSPTLPQPDSTLPAISSPSSLLLPLLTLTPSLFRDEW